MKKILILSLILISYFRFYGQQVDWKLIDNKEQEYDITSSYFFSEDNSLSCLFMRPAARRSQKTFENYALRTYNSDFSKYSQANIPPETPNLFLIKPYKNNVMIIGCDATTRV